MTGRLYVGSRRLVTRVALRAFAFPTLLQAQSPTTGTIRGVVLDPSGAPATQARVILHETQTNFERNLTTDGAGNFIGTLLPLGTDEVTAQAVASPR